MQFVKMHGAGNDFVLVDLFGAADGHGDAHWTDLAQRVCDRHFGVGSDGLLLVLPSATADARMRMFNPDGSESASCGNGIRCLGRYLRDRYGSAPDLSVETGGGLTQISVNAEGAVTVDMGPPLFEPADIPVAADGRDPLHLDLEVDGSRLPVGCVSMGNPHAVTFVERGGLDAYPLEKVGPTVERDAIFPERTNFEVCEVVGQHDLRVRVWERGAGITLACGTGACASAVVAERTGRANFPMAVELPGGRLTIDRSPASTILMTGPTAYVFSGTYSSPE